MVNYQRTEECYKRENYAYPIPIEQKGYEMWLQKVTNPNTVTFYKISDLPIEWRKNKEDKPYPIKHANQIIGIKTADGREWLKSKQQWTAIDGQGNEIMKSFADQEIWDKPIFQYGMKPKDPKNPNGPKEHGVIGVISYSKQYDMPFNQQNLKALYKMRPPEEAASVSLVIQKLGYDKNPIDHPYQIQKYEDFANRPFDELFDYMSTPKYRLDRSARDNLEDSHIK